MPFLIISGLPTVPIPTENAPLIKTQEYSFLQRYGKGALLTVSMMVHAAITGLALGMAPDMDDLVGIAIACFSHEWSHAGALVILYLSLNLSKRAMASLLIPFFFTTPTAITIGILLSTQLEGRSSYITSGVLSALAAGTFVFVATCELLSEAFEVHNDHKHTRRWESGNLLDRMLKFSAFFIFAVAISAVAAIEGEPEPLDCSV